MVEPMEFLLLTGFAFVVAGLALLGVPVAAGGVALGAGLVTVLRAFVLAGAA